MTMRRGLGPFLAIRAAALAILVLPGVAAADAAAEARYAADLVHKVYFEGLPYEDARAVTDAGAAQLVALLDDPAERASWPNIALALGIAARPGAFEALAAAAERGSSGAVDRDEYRFRSALPFAMGHLARSDARALSWLIERTGSRGSDPGWSSGPFAGQMLADQLRRAAISGLGLSGRPEARALLEKIRAEAGRRSAGGDPELAANVETALALQDRIAREGADAALASRRGAE